MSKAIDVIRDALGHLRVVDAQGPLNEQDTADALRVLNLMMRSLEADGINLGWSDVATANDTLPIPPEAEEAIGYGLAVRLRARYGTAPDADVAILAAAGISMLRALAASTEYSRLSYDDLPAGQGSGYDLGVWLHR